MSATVAASALGPHTLAEWRDADQPEDGGRLELLGGWWLVTPAPLPVHQYATARLWSTIEAALAAAGRTDLVALPATGTEVSSDRRDGLIPDVLVTTRQLGTLATAEQSRLVVEVWSRGNTRDERQSKREAYAAAGVAFFWEVHLGPSGPARLEAFRLVRGQWQQEAVALDDGMPVTIEAAPVPVTVDLAAIRL